MRKWRNTFLFLLVLFTFTACRGSTGINETKEAMEAMDSEAIFTHLSQEALGKYNQDDVVARQQKIHADMEITSFAFEEWKENKEESTEDTKVFDATVAMETKYGPMTRPGKYSFNWDEEGREWKLNWTPEVIFPGMGEDRVIRIETVERKRGTIYDRNGEVLAEDAEGIIIGAVAGSFTDENISQAASLLGMTEDSIRQKMENTNSVEGQLIPFIQRASFDQDVLDQLAANNLSYQTDYMRIYPLEEGAAHVIGYLGRITSEELETEKFQGYQNTDLIGKRGLENLYDNTLHNTNGVKVYLAQRGGEEQEILYETEGQDGKDITTTLDVKVQRAIFDQLGRSDGAGAAINPQTGDILALVSTPSFNPYNFMEGISPEEYKVIEEDSRQPLLSKYQYTYSPGSTFKALTAIVGLNTGAITPQTTYQMSGMQWQKDSTWGGYKVTRVIENNAPINLSKAMADSDNIYFARVALDVGPEAFYSGLQGLGMGEAVPGDYPFYTSQINNNGEEFDSEIQLADTGYGQGEVLISPAQLAMIYGGIANEGNIMKPQILVNGTEEVWKEAIATPEVLNPVMDALRRVVTDTYGPQINRSYGQFVGKSGTAEVNKSSQGSQGENRGWFVGFDRSNPNVSLAITINNIQNYDLTYIHSRFGNIFDSIYSGGSYEVTELTPEEAPVEETPDQEGETTPAENPEQEGQE